MPSLGPYRLILGYTSDKDNEFQRAEYLITINAEFNRLRSGHPEMSKYKHWVEEVVSELQTALDEQVIWAKTKENYVFVKQLQQFGVDLGPERPPTSNHRSIISALRISHTSYGDHSRHQTTTCIPKTSLSRRAGTRDTIAGKPIGCAIGCKDVFGKAIARRH
jgi:hypothetical protein